MSVGKNIQLYNEDCKITLSRIADKSVDLIFQDPPYGVTQNEWDKPIILCDLWPEWQRIIKDDGAIIFTASQPFATDLIASNRKLFRYDLVWEKSIATGFLNSKRMPLRAHELVLVFYKKLPCYNPIKNFLPTNSFKKATKNPTMSKNYGDYTNNPDKGTKDGSRMPRSVFSVPYDPEFFDSKKNTVQKMIHPTQKPLGLPRYIISTYSNPGDTVFDGYSGSGSTAIACVKEGRNFIGSEISKEYYEKSIKRIENEQLQTAIF